MTKQIRSKRIIAILIVLVMAVSLSTQALAAGSFSGITGTMNSLFGQPSGRWSITSPTIPSGERVTSVTLTLTVSSGSAPCYAFVQSPQGTIGQSSSTYGPGTYTITFPVFNTQNPQGTWYVWIQTTGTVSTATGRLVVAHA